MIGLIMAMLAFASCSQAADQVTRDADRTVVIQMRDNHFEPDTLEVKRGDTVAFRFMNRGTARHDAFIGDAMTQKGHEEQMEMAEEQHHGDGKMGGEEGAITLEPNETGRITHTFDERGETIIGCHQAGHYDDGMAVTVTVT